MALQRTKKGFSGIATMRVHTWVTAIQNNLYFIISWNDVTLRFASIPFTIKSKPRRISEQVWRKELWTWSQKFCNWILAPSFCGLNLGEKKSQKIFRASSATSAMIIILPSSGGCSQRCLKTIKCHTKTLLKCNINISPLYLHITWSLKTCKIKYNTDFTHHEWKRTSILQNISLNGKYTYFLVSPKVWGLLMIAGYHSSTFTIQYFH